MIIMKKETKIVLALCIFGFVYAVLFNFIFPGNILKSDISTRVYFLLYVYKMLIVPLLFFTVSFLFLKVLEKVAVSFSIKGEYKKFFKLLSSIVGITYFVLLGVFYWNQEPYVLISMIINNAWVFILPGVLLAIGI